MTFMPFTLDVAIGDVELIIPGEAADSLDICAVPALMAVLRYGQRGLIFRSISPTCHGVSPMPK